MDRSMPIGINDFMARNKSPSDQLTLPSGGQRRSSGAAGYGLCGTRAGR
jgi:hypothetical protein